MVFNFKEEFKAWKKDITRHPKKISLSFVFLILAYILHFVAGNYVERVGVATPTDFILDKIPVVDLSMIYVWLFPLILLVFFVYIIIFSPSKIHYYIGIFSLFIAIRAVFLSLTHLANPPGAVVLQNLPFIFEIFSFSNMLFFSGQVAIPYLGYLMFQNRKVKLFMFWSSIIMAILSLLMHIHYTIDVLAAYFITYGIYTMGNYLFGGHKIIHED